MDTWTHKGMGTTSLKHHLAFFLPVFCSGMQPLTERITRHREKPALDGFVDNQPMSPVSRIFL